MKKFDPHEWKPSENSDCTNWNGGYLAFPTSSSLQPRCPQKNICSSFRWQTFGHHYNGQPRQVFPQPSSCYCKSACKGLNMDIIIVIIIIGTWDPDRRKLHFFNVHIVLQCCQASDCWKKRYQSGHEEVLLCPPTRRTGLKWVLKSWCLYLSQPQQLTTF